LRTHRYANHAAVLLVAAFISGYNASGLNTPQVPHTGALDAEAAGDGAQFGDVSLGRDSTIIKPLLIPAEALPSRAPVRYLVGLGDTLDDIARQYGIPMRDVIWSNPGLKLPLKAGEALELPPVPGAVVRVRQGDTAASIANAFGVDPTIVLGYNSIRAAQLSPGMTLVIPVDPTVSPNLSNGTPADPLYPGQFLCPIQGAKIIQKFGPTSFAVEPPYGGYLHFHTGIDLLAFYGTPINAAAGGKVTAVGFAGGFGLRVEVTDSYGLVEIYAHMSDTSVNVGQEVQQGQKVGYVGSTGFSVGPHLHLQLEIGGVPSDPGPLIGCSPQGA